MNHVPVAQAYAFGTAAVTVLRLTVTRPQIFGDRFIRPITRLSGRERGQQKQTDQSTSKHVVFGRLACKSNTRSGNGGWISVKLIAPPSLVPKKEAHTAALEVSLHARDLYSSFCIRHAVQANSLSHMPLLLRGKIFWLGGENKAGKKKPEVVGPKSACTSERFCGSTSAAFQPRDTIPRFLAEGGLFLRCS